MKFGKDFKNHLEETLPEWRDKFLCYKPLKKLIKHLPADDNHHGDNNQNQDDDDDRPRPGVIGAGLEDWFVRILNEELEKFNDFYVDKEEEFVIRLQGIDYADKSCGPNRYAEIVVQTPLNELKERIERVRVSKNGDFTSEREFSEEMLEIRKAFVTIHGEMVLLKNYSSLNFAGLVKILKKYDKRTGGLLSLPFTQRALHQPFFTTEPLTRLVRECEANLELLFPLEAEVVEAGTTTTRDGGDDKNNTETSSAKGETDDVYPRDGGDDKNNTETSSAKGETDDVYRSTLAAIKAIQGLRKASSTYNPLSLAQFFHGQDDDDDASGAVTAENSDSNHLTPLQQNKEIDQESEHSGNQELTSG